MSRYPKVNFNSIELWDICPVVASSCGIFLGLIPRLNSTSCSWTPHAFNTANKESPWHNTFSQCISSEEMGKLRHLDVIFLALGLLYVCDASWMLFLLNNDFQTHN